MDLGSEFRLELARTALVLGAGGFIGHHMVSRLVSEGYYVVGVDLKLPEFEGSKANEFIVGDLRDYEFVKSLVSSQKFSEIYQFAADMGGAGYIFTGENDASVMHNSATINLNLLESFRLVGEGQTQCKIFYSSSACIYPQEAQVEFAATSLREADAYPANPDSEYGWEKLFSERLYFSYRRNFDFDARVARFHNIYGPLGTYRGGREKAPAAICRKVAEAPSGGDIEIWGSGRQTRSFLFISDCIEAVRKLMSGPRVEQVINIGSEEAVAINELAQRVIALSGKDLTIRNVDGPVGVNGRNSNNDLIRELLNWDYEYSLEAGLAETYKWIDSQVSQATTPS